MFPIQGQSLAYMQWMVDNENNRKRSQFRASMMSLVAVLNGNRERQLQPTFNYWTSPPFKTVLLENGETVESTTEFLCKNPFKFNPDGSIRIPTVEEIQSL